MVVVGLGATTVVVEAVGVAGALGVVLAVVGATVIAPPFGVEEVLLRRVRS